MTRHDRVRAPGSIGRNLRERRLAADLTQEALAQAAGVTVRTVARVESDAGRNGPTPAVLSALADALGCSVDELLGRPSKAAS